MNLILPLTFVAAILVFLSRLLKILQFHSAEKSILQSLRPVSPEALMQKIETFGFNANSFLGAYPGFTYFTSKNPNNTAIIPMVVTHRGWVLASEPLASSEEIEEILQELIQSAEAAGKALIALPVSGKFAQSVSHFGFHSIMIGCEPTFNRGSYPPDKKNWNDILPVAKQMKNKDAVVTSFHPSDISQETLVRLNEIQSAWLESRKMEPLAFLNQVHPWLFQDKKKYFHVSIDNQIMAFAAIIPIKASNGWYLIDVLRDPKSIAGAAEFLMLRSIKSLFDSGADFVSLGVSPLSEIEKVPEYPAAQASKNRILYQIFSLIFKKGNLFYGFESLYQFKMKFHPSSAPPAFALIRPHSQSGRIGGILKTVLSLTEAMMPKGVFVATSLNLLRILSQFSLPVWLHGQVRSSIVVKSAPPSWQRLLKRCRLTTLLVFLQISLFSFTRIEVQSIPWLAISPFYSSSLASHVLYLFLTVCFVGSLEFLAGHWIAGLCFLGPAYLIQVAVFFVGGSPSWLVDGVALGCAGCVGALFWFLKNRRFLMGLLIFFSLAGCFLVGSLAPLLSFVAFTLGLVFSWLAISQF